MVLPAGDYILCVDDDEDDCNLLGDSVKKTGKKIELIFLESGEEAIDFLTEGSQQNHLPKLVILDINMPRMNGTEVLLTIRNKLKLNVPVVFLTTTPRNQDILIGENNGASLMAKPKHLAGYDLLVDTIFRSLIPDTSK